MSALQKTPVSVLQELMQKLGHQVPAYELIMQPGLQHLAVFEAVCKAGGVCARGAARSKREAKQQAAHAALVALALRGVAVPEPYRRPPPPHTEPPAPSELPLPGNGTDLARECDAGAGPAERDAGAGVVVPPPAHSHVSLLSELCVAYSLGAPEYALVSDTGPAHQRRFTVSARVGNHERLATATTKKTARQQAAADLYQYLRTHLSRLTDDFVEEEALARAHEKAMERYTEVKEELAWRPDLGQKVADYHLGLSAHLEPEKQAAALSALSVGGAGAGASERTLAAAAAALGLAADWELLPTERGALQVVSLAPTAPPLTVAGADRDAAARQACRFLRQALRPTSAHAR